MSCKLLRITSNYFCAGVEVDKNEVVTRTAPILKYMKGRTIWWIEKYCKKKNWKIEII